MILQKHDFVAAALGLYVAVCTAALAEGPSDLPRFARQLQLTVPTASTPGMGPAIVLTNVSDVANTQLHRSSKSLVAKSTNSASVTVPPGTSASTSQFANVPGCQGDGSPTLTFGGTLPSNVTYTRRDHDAGGGTVLSSIDFWASDSATPGDSSTFTIDATYGMCAPTTTTVAVSVGQPTPSDDCPICDGKNRGEGSVGDVHLPSGRLTYSPSLFSALGPLRMPMHVPTYCGGTKKTISGLQAPATWVGVTICWHEGGRATFGAPDLSGGTAQWISAPNVSSTLTYYAHPNENGATFVVDTIDGRSTEYDSDLLPLLHKSVNGQRVIYTWEPYYGLKLLKRMSDDFGHTIDVDIDFTTLTQTITAPDGSSYVVSATAGQDTYTQPDGSTKVYLFENPDFPNNLTGIVDENGDRYATWAYDSAGRVVLSQRGVDNGVAESEYRFLYGDDNVVTVTDPLGTQRELTYEKDSFNNLVLSSTSLPCTECGENIRAKVIGPNGLMTQSTDFLGNVTTYSWDLSRNLQTSRTDAVGTAQQRTTTIEWEQHVRKPRRIVDPNRTTVLSHDSDGNLLSRAMSDTTTGEVRTWTFSSYTAWGQPQVIDGPRSDVLDVTQLTYYPVVAGDPNSGQLQSRTNAVGHVTSFQAYDWGGRPTTTVDANGVATELTYWPRGWIKTVTTDNCTTTFDYYPTGLIRTVTFPTGGTLTFEYDKAHRLTQIQDGSGNRVRYSLDGMGNRTRTEFTDSSGAITRSSEALYDALDRLWKAVDPVSNETTTFEYDENGNLVAITDSLSNQWAHWYDALNRLSASADASNAISTFQHGVSGALSSVTDARGLATSYSHNAFGELLEHVSPDSGRTTYTYDSSGNVATKTDARGVTVSYQYDALNRVIRTEYPATYWWNWTTYTYDGANYPQSAPYANGRLTGVQTGHESVRIYYNARGNVTRRESTFNNQTATTTYAYDDNGRVTQMTYPTGRVIHYDRDADGRTVRVRQTMNGNTQTIVDGIGYKPFGPIERMVFVNGLTEITSHDSNYRVLGTTVGTIYSRSYEYDAGGRISSIEDLVDAERTQFFTYDPVGRLATAQGAYGSLNWSYDSVGNRLTETRNGLTSTYIYASDSNRLASITGGGASAYSYDDSGNVVSRGGFSFTYDGSGRLLDTKWNGQKRATAIYSFEGLRSFRSEGSTVRRYVYDLSGQIVADLDAATGQALGEVVWLDNRPIAYVTNRIGGTAKETFFIHSDHLGTPQKVTDGSGAVVWDATYSPFGAATVSPQRAIYLSLRLPGQYLDHISGLHQNWHRDYDSSTGRYLQSDPIGLAGGVNTYAYVGGNPVSFIDPMGLAGCYVDYPGYPITIPGTSMRVPLTHAGVLSYDDQGRTRYYEYGRYNSDFGNVRRQTVPDLTMGPDGTPTPDSWARLQQRLNEIGHGTEADTTCDATADSDRINEFAENRMNDPKRAPYSWKPWRLNTCTSFASDAFAAGQ